MQRRHHLPVFVRLRSVSPHCLTESCCWWKTAASLFLSLRHAALDAGHCVTVADAMSEEADQQDQQDRRAPSAPHPAGDTDPLPLLGAQWVAEVSGVAGCLEQLGLGAASEEAYTRVINGCVPPRPAPKGLAHICVREGMSTCARCLT